MLALNCAVLERRLRPKPRNRRHKPRKTLSFCSSAFKVNLYRSCPRRRQARRELSINQRKAAIIPVVYGRSGQFNLTEKHL
jgi:hypothetical protein